MTTEILDTDKTDFVSPEYTTTPLSYLNHIREQDPIHWNDRHKAWFVTRYDDVTNGFKDNRLSANRLKVFRERRLNESQQDTIGRSIRILETWMAFQDEPEHRRLRSIVHKAFTPTGRCPDGCEYQGAGSCPRCGGCRKVGTEPDNSYRPNAGNLLSNSWARRVPDVGSIRG